MPHHVYVFREFSKTKVKFVTCRVKSFSCSFNLLHEAKLMLKQRWAWHHWFWYFYEF